MIHLCLKHFNLHCTGACFKIICEIMWFHLCMCVRNFNKCFKMYCHLPHVTHFWPLHNYIHIQLFNEDLYMQMDNQSSATVVQEARLDRERARKRAKRACESPTEKERRKKANRECNMLRRASESEAQRLQHLTAGQQREADRRASESEAQHLERLTAGQQREADRRASESEAQHLQRLTAAQQYKANCRVSESEAERSQRLAANQQREASRRASESEAERSQRLAANQQREASRRASESEVEHAQRLADGQQRDANHRASESETQRQHRLSGNRERIATYRANATVEERQQRRENDRIIATRRRSAARQSIYDLQREAVKEFRQNIYTGLFNPCYCCTRLCYNNGGSFIDPNNSLLLPVHDRELSNVEPNISNSVWICSRCKSSLKKHKLPPFASVNNMRVPPVPSQLSCLNSGRSRRISVVSALEGLYSRV